MEEYGKILLIAMPAFVVLILIEMIYGHIKGVKTRHIDSISSVSSGMTNILKDVLGLTIAIISYPYLLKFIALVEMPKSIFTYAVTFVLLDFSGYWYHRLTHSVNYFWNLHIIHHSSEEYNLPCALRQQFASFTNITSLIAMIPLALIGVPYEVYLIMAPIHLFAQFWYHTIHIRKMGFLEKIIVTPSHHRVHHAMNDIYMDKNFAQIFIFWDKMFGTFQEELEDVAPIYGVRRQSNTWNPFLINFKHFWLLAKDAYRTNSLKDKFRIWFMPTGWRPQDVQEKYPVPYFKDGDNLKKYDPNYPKKYTLWAHLHITFIFMLLCFLFFQFGKISLAQVYVYGVFLLVYIFSFTASLDKTKYGLILHWICTFFAIGSIYYYNDWYGISNYLGFGNSLLAIVFVLLAITNTYFYINYFRKEYNTISL